VSEANSSLFVLVLILIFLFTLTNGFLDGGGLVSPVIATRAMDPLPALLLMAVCEIAGLFLLGHAVSQTIGLRLILVPDPTDSVSILSMLAVALGSALGWNLAMWKMALPSSSSHALLGGLIGSTWIVFGKDGLNVDLILKILVGLVTVPLIAALISFLLSRFVFWIGGFLTPSVSGLVRGLQILSLGGVSVVHGSNDGQKSLALVLLALAAWQQQPVSHLVPPVWAMLLCGMVLATGLVLGSRRTIQTIGTKFYRIQSLQGLSAGMVTMGGVGASSLLGLPMSSTHVMASAVLGAGAAVHPRAVRWSLAADMAMAWLMTVPATTVIALGVGYVVSKAF